MFFDYQLQKRVKLDMESIAFVHHSSGLPGTSFTTRGDMTLRQHSPLGIRDSFSHLYSDDRIVDKISRSLQTGDSNVEKILEIYAGRAFATDYVERFPIWTRAVKMEPYVDGLMDHFSLSLILPLDPGEQIYSIQVREILLVWDQPAMPLKERQSSFELHWSQHRVILCP